MRRIFILILCTFLLTTAVSAAGIVTDLDSHAAFSSDGTCQISLSARIEVDSDDGDLRFPLPGDAKDITLNGKSASTSRGDGVRWVNLGDMGSGTHTLNLHYSLPDLVTEQEDGLMLTLPLLSGFSYPVDYLTFSVDLPGEPESEPLFTSTYHPESMENILVFTVDGNTISGSCEKGLKDHETLTMTLPVNGKMFPQTIAKRWSLSYDDLLQYGLLLLAAIYWLIFLRSGLPQRFRRVQAPNGITAGELGCCIGGLGVDFPMMVLSWAEMGYLTIQIDRHNRVLLRKTMDMGNERSEFEVRYFRSLFGKRQVVDGGGAHFARLSRKAGKAIPGAWHYFRKASGNPLIFRCIAAGVGAVAGYSLAVAFASDTVWQVILSILLVPLGAVLSWFMQNGAKGIHLRHRLDLLLACAAAFLILLLAMICGEVAVAIFVIISQFLAGLAAIHGSRRTESGIQARSEIFGLRKYLKSIPPLELRRITEHNPDYYFSMAPYAIALGVDKPFARQFGQRKLTACPYLEVSGSQNLSASQWNVHLRQVVQTMDDRQRRRKWQKLFGK